MSTILSFNIFFAGDVACGHNTTSQINQPIPQVTMKSKPSRMVAHKRTPFSHGTMLELSELELFDGGSGGGVENGSDIDVSF